MIIIDENETFTMVPNKVLKCESLTTNEKMVYIVVKSFCFGMKNKCFPSYQSIAELASCSESTAKRSMKTLIEKGFVEVTYRGLGQSNIYTLTNIANLETQ